MANRFKEFEGKAVKIYWKAGHDGMGYVEKTNAGHLFMRLGNNEATWISAHMIDDMEALPEVESDFLSPPITSKDAGKVINFIAPTVNTTDGVTFAAGVSINTKGTAFEESEPENFEVGVDLAAPDSDKTALYLENAAMAREAKQGDYFPPAKDLPNQHVFSPQHEYLYTWVGSEKKVLDGVTFASVTENEPTVNRIAASKIAGDAMERFYPGFMAAWNERDGVALECVAHPGNRESLGMNETDTPDINEDALEEIEIERSSSLAKDVDSLSIAMETGLNGGLNGLSGLSIETMPVQSNANGGLKKDDEKGFWLAGQRFEFKNQTCGAKVKDFSEDAISQRLNELSTINDALIMGGRESIYGVPQGYLSGLDRAYFDKVNEIARDAMNKRLVGCIEQNSQYKPKRDKNGSRPKKKPRISFKEGQYRCHFGNGKGIFALGVGATYEEAYMDWKVKHDDVQGRAKVTRTAL